MREQGLSDYLVLLRVYQTCKYRGVSFLKFLLSQALLSGLPVCGRCGYRMVVNYNNAHNGPRYNCHRALTCYGEPACQSLSGRRRDAFLTGQVPAALQPAALELHLAAARDVEQQRQRLHQNWQQQSERARYEADRAARQYQAVEPENRLVPRELERRWEAALQEQARLEQDCQQFCARRPAKLSAAERVQGQLPDLHVPSRGPRTARPRRTGNAWSARSSSGSR
jgi:hypothetical protein